MADTACHVCSTCRMCVDAQGGTICCLDSGASHHGRPVGEKPQLLLVSSSVSSCAHHRPAGVEITQDHSPHACCHATINNSSYRLPLARLDTARLEQINNVQLESCRWQSFTTETYRGHSATSMFA